MEPKRVFLLNDRVMGKYFLALGFMIIMMSCGKDIDQFIPRESQDITGDVSRLMSRLQSDINGDIHYIVSCPCQGDQAYQFDKDVVLVIPPGFVDLTQYPCVNGSFDIEVTVIDTKGEIIIAGIPTISEHKLLESRIEINIQIKDGTTPVKLAHNKQIRILVNDPDPRERMELFYGSENEWIQADNNPETWDNVYNGEWWIQQDSLDIITGFGYECMTDSLDWINVDVFFDIPEEQRTEVCVDLPQQFSNTNTTVFMVFDDYNSILSMRGDSSIKQFCEPYGSTPIGFHVTFVIMAELGPNDYYFAAVPTTIYPNQVEIINPKKTPYEEIKNYLKSL